MTHQPKSIIHINFMPNVLRFEPRRVWTALEKAEELGKLTAAARLAIESRLGRTAIHIASRDYVITAAVTALRKALQSLARLVPENIPEIDRGGKKYRVVHTKALEIQRDRVLLAVDSFLFEFRSYLELLAKFIFDILQAMNLAPSGQQILSSGESVLVTDHKGKLKSHALLLYLCDQLKVSRTWYDFLVFQRNFFTHSGAPYIAVEDRLMLPTEYDFIIMRENIHQFQAADPKDYFRLSEFKNVVNGLAQFAGAAQHYLVALLEN